MFLTSFKPNCYTEHNSAGLGEILNPSHNLEIFRALVYPKWSLCIGHLALPGEICQRKSKNIVHIS